MKQLNILLGAAAIAVASCVCGCNQPQATNTPAAKTGTETTENTGGFKVAYVQIDTLLSNYQFSKDLNEAMVKKQENVRATLNQKVQSLENAKKEFQTKMQNNAFLSEERAQQEYNRIAKMEQDAQNLSEKLQRELLNENDKYNLQLRDTITAFLKEYNVNKKYDMILSNTGFDNLLIADEKFDITNEVLEGLNARYQKVKGKK